MCAISIAAKSRRCGATRSSRSSRCRSGVTGDLAKKIVRIVKDSKLKVQGSIQGEAVRVCGAKRDVLQEVIALVRKSVTDVPLQFGNFRD